MRRYTVRFTKEAVKDIKKIPLRLKNKLKNIISKEIIVDPYSGKKLVGDLEGFYSIRLSYKDRIVYSIDSKEHILFVHRARTHYGE
jgi:mRNA interferase RelE/StbE